MAQIYIFTSTNHIHTDRIATVSSNRLVCLWNIGLPAKNKYGPVRNHACWMPACSSAWSSTNFLGKVLLWHLPDTDPCKTPNKDRNVVQIGWTVSASSESTNNKASFTCHHPRLQQLVTRWLTIAEWEHETHKIGNLRKDGSNTESYLYLVQQDNRTIKTVGRLNDQLPWLASSATDSRRRYLLFASLSTTTHNQYFTNSKQYTHYYHSLKYVGIL